MKNAFLFAVLSIFLAGCGLTIVHKTGPRQAARGPQKAAVVQNDGSLSFDDCGKQFTDPMGKEFFGKRLDHIYRQIAAMFGPGCSGKVLVRSGKGAGSAAKGPKPGGAVIGRTLVEGVRTGIYLYTWLPASLGK